MQIYLLYKFWKFIRLNKIELISLCLKCYYEMNIKKFTIESSYKLVFGEEYINIEFVKLIFLLPPKLCVNFISRTICQYVS